METVNKEEEVGNAVEESKPRIQTVEVPKGVVTIRPIGSDKRELTISFEVNGRKLQKLNVYELASAMLDVVKRNVSTALDDIINQEQRLIDKTRQ